MSQLHGINGAQQPQATGISPSVGKLGLHSVQLGTNPPVRLDAIKGNKIPFAGFRTATKVVNAKTGARENAALALRSLASPDGKLDAKALLNAAKSMQTHLNRLGTLGEIRGTMDDAVIAAFAPEVEYGTPQRLPAVPFPGNEPAQAGAASRNERQSAQ